MTGFIYIAIIMFQLKYKIKIDKIYIIIGILSSLVLSILVNSAMFSWIFYIFAFQFIIKIDFKDSKYFKYLRYSSTIMYFIHIIVFFILTLIVGISNCEGYLGFLWTLIVTIALSIILIFFKENRVIKYLFF